MWYSVRSKRPINQELKIKESKKISEAEIITRATTQVSRDSKGHDMSYDRSLRKWNNSWGKC